MEPEKKVHVKLDVESIVRSLDLEQAIEVADKLDEIVLDYVFGYITNSADNGYATDDEIREFVKEHSFELLRAIYTRGNM